MSIQDIFEPRWEPARSIYLAFQDEASKRGSRSVAEWTSGEQTRVHAEAIRQAQLHGLRAPALEEVSAAEITARGHIDYGAKWAYRIVERMRNRDMRI